MRMTWWERWAFNALHVVVAVTGVMYFVMEKMMTPVDDPFTFTVVNHPWQPVMLSSHVLAAPFFVAFFGMLFRSHTVKKLQSPSAKNRRSGWVSLLSFSAMAVTGYLMQVATSLTWVSVFMWTHVVTSCLFLVGYTVHLAIGWRLSRGLPLVGRMRSAPQTSL